MGNTYSLYSRWGSVSCIIHCIHKRASSPIQLSHAAASRRERNGLPGAKIADFCGLAAVHAPDSRLRTPPEEGRPIFSAFIADFPPPSPSSYTMFAPARRGTLLGAQQPAPEVAWPTPPLHSVNTLYSACIHVAPPIQCIIHVFKVPYPRNPHLGARVPLGLSLVLNHRQVGFVN